MRRGEPDVIHGDEKETQADGAVGEVVRRHYRVSGQVVLVEGQRYEKHHASYEQADDPGGLPLRGRRRGQREREQEKREAAAEKHHASDVDLGAEFVEGDSGLRREPFLLRLALVIQKRGDDEAGAERHDDGQHADAPAPADAVGRRHVVDDEGGRPRHDQERPERDADAERPPPRRRDVGDHDVVEQVRPGLPDEVQHQPGGVHAEVLGCRHEHVRQAVERDGDGVHRTPPDDVGQLRYGRLHHGEYDGAGCGESRELRKGVEVGNGVVPVDVYCRVVELAMSVLVVLVRILRNGAVADELTRLS